METEDFAFQSLAEAKLELFDDEDATFDEESTEMNDLSFNKKLLPSWETFLGGASNQMGKALQRPKFSNSMASILADTKYLIQKTKKVLAETHEYQIRKRLKF